MSDYLINQLYFRTNAKTILGHIQSTSGKEQCPAEFSFNSIRRMPKPLRPASTLSINRHIECLSLMNSDLSVFDPAIRKNLMAAFDYDQVKKQPEEKIQKAIEQMRQLMGGTKTTQVTEENLPVPRLLDQAVDNYREFNFFSWLDWRLAHWGTVEDVHSVVRETFKLPTTFIEFETRWTPPVAVIQSLANDFPSVRFELRYRFPDDTSWNKVEFFPTVPFGY